MFTGLIQEKGKIIRLHHSSKGIQLTCQVSATLLAQIKIGDSIAVDGACLTCISKKGRQFTVDIMPETFKRTCLSQKHINDTVNIELAMAASSRFEGHIVTGHIDSQSRLLIKKSLENALVLTFSYPSEYEGEIIPQGSVAINGVSLTVVSCDEKGFTVSLIPHSRQGTNLGHLRLGDSVNIETDILGKYIKAQLNGERRAYV